MGTGPWKLVDWNRGSAVKYTKYDDYWNDDVDVTPNLTLRVFTDPKTRVDSLITNQVDLSYQVGASDAEGLALNEAITVESSPSMRVRMVYLDLSDDLMSDQRVREALNIAVDRDQLANVGFFGYAQPASTYFPTSHWASVEEESAAHGSSSATPGRMERTFPSCCPTTRTRCGSQRSCATRSTTWD